MCVQLWSLLGRSRCFHSFIQDLLEDVSFCSSWLDLGEEWGSKFLPVHTDYRMWFLVLKYSSHRTTSYSGSLSSGLKTSAFATCQLQIWNIKTRPPKRQSFTRQAITFTNFNTFIKKTPFKKFHLPHKHCTELDNVSLPSRDFST